MMLKRGSKLKKGLKKFVNSHYLLYCTVALIALCAVFYWVWAQNKTFIWVPDSSSQHFASFVYLGKYLRELARSLFSGHFAIPQYNFSMGFGEDILTTLHYYVIGDPLNLLSVFVPSEYAPYAYSFLMILRYFLAGFAFTVLAKYKKIPAYASVSGALIYSFTVYTFYMAVRHPSFLNPYIYFPLIILGVEMIFDKKRPYLFILSICLSAMSSFYFFFAISIFTVLYIFVRLFFQYKEHFIKNFFISLGQFGGSYILGVMMSALVFLPVVLSFLTSSRGSVEYGFEKLFDRYYYEKFIAAFTAGINIRTGVYMGFTALALAGVALLFLSVGKKKSKEDKKQSAFLITAFIIVTAMMMLPLVDKIINGFSYVTNRWSFVYGLLSAFIFAFSIKNIKEIGMIRSGLLCFFAMVYYYYIEKQGIGYDQSVMWQFRIIAAFSVLLFAYSIVQKAVESNKGFGVFFKTAVVVLSVLAVFTTAEFEYNPKNGFILNAMMTEDEAVDFSANNAFKIMKKYQNTDSAVERYEEIGASLGNINNSMLNDTYSTQEYYSMANARVNELYKDIGSIERNFSVINSSCDPFVNSVENVKYVVSTWANDSLYGINKNPIEKFTTDIDSAEKKIFENENYVPFGFTYDSVISAEDYNALSSTEKRAMLLNAAVLNDSDDFVNAKASDFGSEDILPEFTVETDDKTEFEDNRLVAKDDGASITVKMENVPDGELYFVFENIHYYPENISDSSSWFVLNGNNRGTHFNLTTPYNDYYSGIHNFVATLGYCSSGSAQITIGVAPGVYEFDSIHPVVQSLDEFEEKTAALSEDTLQNLEIGTDKISGSITLDESKVLFLSVPYSEYWTAEVDGEAAEVLRANTAFTAISLDAGEHTVELKYNNTSIVKSAFVSLLGAAVFAGLVFVIEKKKRIGARRQSD